MASEIGRVSPMAAAVTRTSRISSVAYAVDEMGSEEKTARATRLETRWWTSCEVFSGAPRRMRLAR